MVQLFKIQVSTYYLIGRMLGLSRHARNQHLMLLTVHTASLIDSVRAPPPLGISVYELFAIIHRLQKLEPGLSAQTLSVWL